MGLLLVTANGDAGEVRVFPPAAGSSVAWLSINDGVMGGISSGTAQIAPEGELIFSGRVSLERNGGFASVRTAPAALSAQGAHAVRLEIRGDGKRYKLNLRTDAAFDGVQYQAAFDTKAGEWAKLVLPIEAFVPRFRGREVPDAPALDPARIVTIGFLISDRQEGPFRLDVRSITFETRVEEK